MSEAQFIISSLWPTLGRNISYFDLLITLLCAERVRCARSLKHKISINALIFPFSQSGLLFMRLLLAAHDLNSAKYAHLSQLPIVLDGMVNCVFICSVIHFTCCTLCLGASAAMCVQCMLYLQGILNAILIL